MYLLQVMRIRDRSNFKHTYMYKFINKKNVSWKQPVNRIKISEPTRLH